MVEIAKKKKGREAAASVKTLKIETEMEHLLLELEVRSALHFIARV